MGRRFQVQSPFEAAMKLLTPTYTRVKGVPQKTFPDPDKVEEVFFGSFRTYGGTESISNGVYTVFDTGTIRTWYNPNIKSDCRIYMCDTGEIFEVISRPEDINVRHQYMNFKVKLAGGKP